MSVGVIFADEPEIENHVKFKKNLGGLKNRYKCSCILYILRR